MEHFMQTHDDFDPNEIPIPDEETRKIQASIYKRLMQKTLMVDQLEKWKDYLDKDIVISLCESCTRDPITESGNEPNPAAIEKISETISQGKCACTHEQYDDDVMNEAFRLVHLACMKEEFFPILMYLKKINCDFNAKCSGHIPTPLHIAIYHNQLETVKFLINCGVDVNYTSNFVDSPLAVAMASERDDIVETLLACKEIKVNMTNRRNQTLLAHCIRVKSKYVERLLQAGADPNMTGPLRTSPLMYAVQMRNIDTVKLLLRYGADVNLKNGREDVPLLIALYTGSTEIMRILLDAGADPNYAHSDGNTPLLIACYDNQIDIVELLLRYHAIVSKGNSNGYTPLHIAAWNGHLNSVRVLLKAGALYDIPTNDKNTPLALAAHGGHLSVIEELLPLGCKINNYDKDNDTPLHYAAYNGMTRAVELFIEHGADPNCLSTCMATPLWNAVYKGQKEVVKLLIKKNVKLEVASIGTNQHSHTDDVVHVYATPKTPLWVALERKHSDIALLLVSAGYNIFSEQWLISGNFPEHFDERLCNLLTQYVHSPPKLIAVCRNYYRKNFGLDVIARVQQMDIPVTLKKYLTLADLQYTVNEKDTTVRNSYDSSSESEDD
ncbi:ankyrin-3-like [Mercenaria mercenaria]|uniref:ankyrin-3-like n=1 Tax=Mercenaria mercenaria TaxID=6596 RepID=UPI001E1DD428|nr:ankyrin-3-like [Mercenaria mercenaria]XP_045184802.1 ankyrin-3-like [Mercenaria mercenaria]XP_045184809.1 ankyrin-3-like [Mercenaria mercenaria]XP_045184817.1 ankyrin-3-like [Mercenaria mercenaria]